MASYKVLYTFLSLYQCNMTMHELISSLNKLNLGVFNPFIVQKYIHTLKSCGINIQKIHNKYSIVNFSFGTKLSEEDATLLHNLKTEYEKASVNDMEYAIHTFFTKLHLPFYKYTTGSVYGPHLKILKFIKYAFNTNVEVMITYKNSSKEICFIREIKIVDKKYYFLAANENCVKEVALEDIENVELIQKPSKITFGNTGVIYELYGSNAERYQLRPNEKILRYNPPKSIVILNEYEEKTLLIQRLLRYDSSCKILEPADFSNQMLEEINGALMNYNIGSERKSKKYIINKLKKENEKAKK